MILLGRGPDDLHPFDVSTLVIPGARLKVYPAAPQDITDTHAQQLSIDLLEFVTTT